MNVFKFCGADGRYITVIPYKNRWLVLEESSDQIVIEYMFIPHLGEQIRALNTDRGIRYLYGDKCLYLRHCTIKHIPGWAVMGSTI
jgi:hypothetical protein